MKACLQILAATPDVPQCRGNEEKEQFEKITERLKKAEQTRGAQGQSRLVLAKLDKTTLVKEATRYIVTPEVTKQRFVQPWDGGHDTGTNESARCYTSRS